VNTLIGGAAAFFVWVLTLFIRLNVCTSSEPARARSGPTLIKSETSKEIVALDPS